MYRWRIVERLSYSDVLIGSRLLRRLPAFLHRRITLDEARAVLRRRRERRPHDFLELVRDADSLFLCSKHARILHFAIGEVPVLAGAGRGVRRIRIASDDEVLGGAQMSRASDCLRVKNTSDKVVTFGQMKYQLTSRGGKGVKTSARTGFVEIVRPEIQLVDWAALEG